MKISEITPLTEIIRPYVKAVADCQTKAELVVELSANWHELFPEALRQAEGLPDDESWAWVLQHRRQKKHAQRVCELAGAIFLPETLMNIGVVVEAFKVPDGLAFIKLSKLGLLDSEAEAQP